MHSTLFHFPDVSDRPITVLPLQAYFHPLCFGKYYLSSAWFPRAFLYPALLSVQCRLLPKNSWTCHFGHLPFLLPCLKILLFQRMLFRQWSMASLLFPRSDRRIINGWNFPLSVPRSALCCKSSHKSGLDKSRSVHMVISYCVSVFFQILPRTVQSNCSVSQYSRNRYIYFPD